MSKDSLIASVKSWLFPSLVTILAMMIWRDVTEMRSDIKSLLAQSNIDKTKIEQLEKDVRSIELTVFNKKPMVSDILPFYLIHQPALFKHEEFYTFEKNIQNEKL